tara:strand:+ start:722 stop:889 length:168 start_codon:yes stop_codon:yes gene_type:complete
MARDVFGNKKIRKDDLMTGKHMITHSDVRMEYAKGFLWLACGYGYFHFVIAGWLW